MHNESMIYGYARVSTAAQDETGQVRQLKAAGCEKVFREKITGTTADRPQLRQLMAALARVGVRAWPLRQAWQGEVRQNRTSCRQPARQSNAGPHRRARSHPTSAARGTEAARERRDTAQRRAQL
jgi:Resolvase, N terminal domain